jgi:hypothetical protein
LSSDLLSTVMISMPTMIALFERLLPKHPDNIAL